MGQLIYLKDVVSLALDREKCVDCGICLIVCPHDVIALNNGHAQIENRDACMECGACARNCPTEAVTVQAGVGCATAVINTALGRDSSSCCCVIEPKETSAATCVKSDRPDRTSCC
jgi:NAD-dependent dihydropyrimidine dehydrogenase PreA subunit